MSKFCLAVKVCALSLVDTWLRAQVCFTGGGGLLEVVRWGSHNPVRADKRRQQRQNDKQIQTPGRCCGPHCGLLKCLQQQRPLAVSPPASLLLSALFSLHQLSPRAAPQSTCLYSNRAHYSCKDSRVLLTFYYFIKSSGYPSFLESSPCWKTHLPSVAFTLAQMSQVILARFAAQVGANMQEEQQVFIIHAGQ